MAFGLENVRSRGRRKVRKMVYLIGKFHNSEFMFDVNDVKDEFIDTVTDNKASCIEVKQDCATSQKDVKNIT